MTGTGPNQADLPIIRASEIGQYAFCARAWWLGRVQGYLSANVRELSLGQTAHRAHGRAVAGYQQLQRLAWLLLLAAIIVGAFLVFVAR